MRGQVETLKTSLAAQKQSMEEHLEDVGHDVAKVKRWLQKASGSALWNVLFTVACEYGDGWGPPHHSRNCVA